MAYKKTDWRDTLRDAQGNVIQRGTPLNAQALGKIEDGIVGAEQKIDNEIQQVTQQLAQKATQADLDSVAIRAKKVEGSTDDTNTFIADMNKAIAGNSQFVYTDKKDYQIVGDLRTFDDGVIPLGKGQIVSSNPNNRYFKVFDPRASSGVLTAINPAFKYENIAKFAKALVTAKGGGAKVKVVFVGDSLTQGAHRISDNYWWVYHLQTKLIEQFGDFFEFYNRGWAGSKIEHLADVLTTSITPPFETDWVTDKNVKRWIDYVNDLSPDLVITAFGMNETTGDSYKAITDGRSLLKGITSSPDIVWVTSPIRTVSTDAVYNGNPFGAYPDNEYSNNAGMLTRLIAQRFGDACIDVNRNTSISYLGFDPYQYRLNRWFGQYHAHTGMFTGSVEAITQDASQNKVMDMKFGRILTTSRLIRNFNMEFIPEATGNLNPLKITCRKDPKSNAQIIFQIYNTRIDVYGLNDNGTLVILNTWSGDCRGKKVRIEVVGSRVRVHIADSGWVIDNKTAGKTTQFIAPIEIRAQADTASILNAVNISADFYKAYIPRITANEVFSVQHGDGGNGLNHPNTKGELEIYEQPLDEFVASLSNIEYLSKLNAGTGQSSVETGNVTLPEGVTGSITYLKTGKVVTLVFSDIAGTFGNAASLVVLPTTIRPSGNAIVGILTRVANATQEILTLDVRYNGNVYVYNTPSSTSVKFAGTLTYVTNN